MNGARYLIASFVIVIVLLALLVFFGFIKTHGPMLDPPDWVRPA